MSYYSDRLVQFGMDVRALGWGSGQSQWLRFKVLSEVAELADQSILDFGCGFGDLYLYLEPIGIKEYTGCDDNLEMLECARSRYPEARFLNRPVEADYILESGAFNLTSEWHSEVKTLWDGFCRKGMALNFTSSLANSYTPGIVYADPFKAIEFLSTLTKKFVLRHDYKPNDFTVYLYK